MEETENILYQRLSRLNVGPNLLINRIFLIGLILMFNLIGLVVKQTLVGFAI